MGVLDLASDVSIISVEIVEKIKLRRSVYEGSVTRISGVGSKVTECNKYLDLKFGFYRCNDRYCHSFCIVDNSCLPGYNMILGSDFLNNNKCVINVESRELWLQGKLASTIEPDFSEVGSMIINAVIVERSNDCCSKSEPVNLAPCHNVDSKDVLTRDVLIVSEIKREIKSSVEKQPEKVVYSESKPVQVQNQAVLAVTREAQRVRMKCIPDKERERQRDIAIEKILHECEVDGKLIDRCRNQLDNHRGIIAIDSLDVGKIKGYVHVVKLNDYKPITSKQYPIPDAQKGALACKLDEFIRADIIEPGVGPWNSPIIIREKKDGTIRLVLDAKKINDITQKMDYPFSDLRDILGRLGGFQYFSSIDMENGYHQILLDEQSRAFFGFRTPWGKFQFKRLPMGATNSGLYFQKVVEEILADVVGENVIVFQDDILVATKSAEQHIEILERLFIIFENVGITIKAKKCNLLRKEIKFLGHVISDSCIKPDPDNVKCIRDLPPPRNKKLVRSFLGRINFYARFIKELAKIATPIQKLIKGKQKDICWDKEAEEAFNRIKCILINDPILSCPDYSKPFRLCVSHGNNSVSAVLEQVRENTVWPVGYYSRKLKASELNYTTLEKEAMAIVDGLEHYRHIVHGYQVVIYSSQCSLEYLRGLREGNSRISRWICKMLRNSPEFVKRGEDSNTMSDLLVCDDWDDYGINESIIDKEKEVETDSTVGDLCPIFYTDGSCIKNGKTGAQAGIGVYSSYKYGISISSRIDGKQTNNRAELLAIIKALEIAMESKLANIKIVTDSKYVVENVQDNLENWIKKDGVNHKGKSIINYGEYTRLYQLLKNINVTWELVKGHTKVRGNEIANTLAMKGAEKEDMRELAQPNNDSLMMGQDTSNPEQSNTENKDEVVDVSALIVKTDGTEIRDKVTLGSLLEAQQGDPEMMKIIGEVDKASTCSWDEKGIVLYKNVNGLIYARGRIGVGKGKSMLIDCVYVPKMMRHKIIQQVHESKWSIHPQFDQLCMLVLKDYFWATFRSDIRTFLKTCLPCQKVREVRSKVPVLTFERPTTPWYMISIDIVGPLCESQDGNVYILSMVDLFTRFITLIPLPDQRTSSVLWAIEKYYVTRFGVPKIILSDNASNFCSKLFNEICQSMGTEHRVITPWHPQCNGTIERANRELKKYLTHLCEKASDSWDKKIHYVEFVLNNTIHSATGYTPSEMLYGTSMRSPDTQGFSEADFSEFTMDDYIVGFKSRVDTIRKMGIESDTQIQKVRNNHINSKRRLKEYHIGQEILYRRVRRRGIRNNGFTYRYEGPYSIVGKVSDVTYKINSPNKGSDRVITTHVDRIKGVSCLSHNSVVGKEAIAKIVTNESNVPTNDKQNEVCDGSDEAIPDHINKMRVESAGNHANQVADIIPQPTLDTDTGHNYFTRSKGLATNVDYNKMKFDKGGRIRLDEESK